MKHSLTFFLLCACTVVGAAQRSKDPVTAVMKVTLNRQRTALVVSAERLPPEKYTFRLTPQGRSFAQIVVGVVELNYDLCATTGDVTAPRIEGLKESDGKEKLIAALAASFKFCDTAFVNLNDTKLGDTVKLSREMDGPRAATLFALTEGWADSYRAVAEYLQLNGLKAYP